MVIMDNYYLQDRLSELWNRIDKMHLTFLDVEESPEKIEIRSKLEDLIREYLCAASHNQKFSLPVTYDILYRSAHGSPDFSGYKAATGFNALQMYAGNLLSQPWRKEYKHIRKYSGFYKHQVEANLVNGELLLVAMGYKPVGLSTYVLDGPIGPDRVITASKDCLIAYVECQILKVIWEEMASSNINMSWAEILDFRRTHLCGPENSIKGLKYQYQQKHFQEHIRNNSQGNVTIPHAPPSYSSQTVPPLTNQNLPVLSQYLYGTNGCCHNSCMPYAQMDNSYPPLTYPSHNLMKPHFNTNGYYYSNGLTPQVPVYNHSVPIAQLIEVEPQNGYDAIDRPCHSRSTLKTQNLGEMYANYNNEDSVIRDNRDSDKTDSQFEDWDYVYKSLENQGYSKDLGERGDVLIHGLDSRSKPDHKNSDKKRKEKEFKKSKDSNLDMAMSNLTLQSRPKQTVSDKIDKQKKPTDSKCQVLVSPASSYDNLTSNDKKQSAKSSNLSKPKLINSDKSTSTVKQSSKPIKKEEKLRSRELKSDGSTWQCKTCTFLNQNSKSICDMCSKSRSNVEEEIEVGGAECEKCTLVNPKDAKICQACLESLENSPTRV